MQKSISEHTTHQTSKWIDYGRRKPISIKNKSNKHLIKCSLSVNDVPTYSPNSEND